MDERVRERYALGALGQEAMDHLRYRREEMRADEYDPYGEATVLALLAIVAELRRLPG